MDKVKAILEIFKRYHFWILCVGIVITGISTWFVTTADLSRQYRSHDGKIKSTKQSMDSIASEQNHPNDQFAEGMDELIRRRRDNVRDAWVTKWDQLRENLVWPKQLRSDFIDKVKLLMPFENVATEEEILPVHLRERYKNYITNELPKMAEKIGSQWVAVETERGGRGGFGSRQPVDVFRPGGGGGHDEDQDDVIVHWDGQNQSHILSDHFAWEEVPTTLQVLYAQEDLWVLRALLDVIHRTNGDVDLRHRAAIKRIDSILIGYRDVQGQVGQVKALKGKGDKQGKGRRTMGMSSQSNFLQPSALDTVPGGAGPGMGAGAMPPGPGGHAMPPGLGGHAMPPGLGGGEAPLGPPDPADQRYVDRDYQPLSAEALRSQSGTADNAYLAVAKRMPIRMNLVVDQTKLDKLLVECGNSPLTVEIRQVRFNRSGGNSQNAGRRIQAGGAQQPRSSRGPTGLDSERGEELMSYDISVELYGIIYIYNPVDRKKLEYLEEEETARYEMREEPAVALATAHGE